mmetsp:Transcript_64511/g.200013  ORF Transcript_64511/g.200013 Transcript_64511/m.200013 type:complete len:202 (+) Transcript_64511:988-1593(+)
MRWPASSSAPAGAAGAWGAALWTSLRSSLWSWAMSFSQRRCICRSSAASSAASSSEGSPCSCGGSARAGCCACSHSICSFIRPATACVCASFLRHFWSSARTSALCERFTCWKLWSFWLVFASLCLAASMACFKPWSSSVSSLHFSSNSAWPAPPTASGSSKPRSRICCSLADRSSSAGSRTLGLCTPLPPKDISMPALGT